MQSRLAITRDDLMAKVGHFLGYSRDSSAWNPDQLDDIEDCVKTGLRMFYFPPPVGGESHEWSFLKPTLTISFTSGTYQYLLPADFGGFVGDLTFTGTSSAMCARLPVVGEEMIRRLRGDNSSATGRPQLAAQHPLKVDHSQSQRWELIVYPTPDATYTASYTANLLPDALFEAKPYPYGGPEHSEAIVAACLAAAEQHIDDMQGVHTAAFGIQLAAAIKADKQRRPRNLGYNRDLSDGLDEGPARHGIDPVTITYNGTEWGT